MKYKVIDTFKIAGNTSISIEGDGDGIKNGMIITDSDGKKHKIISVAMYGGESLPVLKTTTILVEGKFESSEIIL